MLQGSADAAYPQLIPRITLSDGSVLMPLAWFKDVTVTRNGAATEVRWRQEALDLIGQNDARVDERLSIVTRYVLSPGRIARDDTITIKDGAKIARIDIEFATFSSGGARSSPSATRFATGEVRGFETRGLGLCSVAPVNDALYRAPTGSLQNVVRCALTPAPAATLALGWTLTYQPDTRR